MITEPGIYDLPASEYHLDCAPGPSLSSSTARDLLGRSPYHVWHAHPKLNAAPQDDDADEAMDIGTAVHAFLLEGREAFTVINAPNYRTKEAQTAKADARAAGKVPLLVHRWNDVMNMATAALQQLQRHEDPPLPLANGKPEQTIVWREDDVWCRARLDWLHDDRRTIDDLKTTRVPANPELWSRLLYRMNYHVQAAWYLRGLQAVTGVELDHRAFRFVVIENTAPYRLSVIALSPAGLALGQRAASRGLAKWRHCLATDQWPAYPTRTCYADPPAWAEAQSLEHEIEDEPLIDDGRPLAEQMFGGQL